MGQGLTAATLGSPPLDFLAKKLGFVVLARAHELFSFPASGLVTTVKKIKERPYEIKRVIKAGIKASRYIRQNREGTLPVMMEWLKIDKDIAATTYESVWKAFSDDGSLPENGLRIAIEEAKRVGKVAREVSFSEVADLSILKETQKELGLATINLPDSWEQLAKHLVPLFSDLLVSSLRDSQHNSIVIPGKLAMTGATPEFSNFETIGYPLPPV